MNKKAILYINDFETGGGAENVFLTCYTMFAQEYQVYHYTAYKEFKDTGKNPFSYIFSIKHSRAIKQLIVENKIDIVHIHTFRWVTPAVLLIIKKLKRTQQYRDIRVIVTAHDYFLVCPNVAYGYYKQGMFKLFDENAVRKSFFFKQMDQHGAFFSWLKKLQWYLSFKLLHVEKEIDIVVTPSDFMGKIIRLNYPKLKTITIRNPLPVVSIANERSSLPQALQNPFRIIYLGRVASEKGIDKLLLQLAIIKNNLPKIHLAIYGTGPYAAYVSQLIKERALENIVQYHGHIHHDKVDALLSTYDAFIMSSIWYENAPLAIIEAAMHGLALIIPDMGGMKEMAMLCGNAFFYNLDDSNSLSTALWDSYNSRKNTENRDIRTVLETFSLELFKSELEKIYNT